MTKRVTVYGKPGCHLCEEAERAVEAVCSRFGIEIERVNIMSDPVLAIRYGFDIPVVAVDGAVVGTHFINTRTLEEKLKETDRHADQIEGT